MYKINTVFLRFRLRQFLQIAKEIPIPYLFILTAMAIPAFFFLFRLAEERTGGMLIGGFFLFFIFIFHRTRKDFKFLHLIDPSPRLLFGLDYMALGLPVLLVELLQRHVWISAGIVAGCIGIGLLKQPARRLKKTGLSPSFIPREAIEWKTGIRQRGMLLSALYLGAYAGLFLPYLSFVFTWLFTCILTEFFRYSESLRMLCASECSARKFLNRKLKISLVLYSILLLPIYLFYLLFYPESWFLPLLFFSYGLLNISLMVVSKYALYSPNTLLTTGQPALVFSLFGMIFPVLLPLTLFFIGKKYHTAYRNLNTYLYAYN